MAEVDRLQEPGEVEAYWAARRQAKFAAYRTEGREQSPSRAWGDHWPWLSGSVATRFGTDAADLLEKHVKGVEDSVRPSDVGDWIADCATGAELIERFEAALWEARRKAMVEVYRAEGRAEGREQGRVQGRDEGREQGRAQARAEQRDLLRRQAVRRFGDDVEAPIEAVLEVAEGAEGLVEVGKWIADYGTSAELVECLQWALPANRAYGKTTTSSP